MKRELDCVGKIILGELSEKSREQLNAFEGEWLEFSGTDPSIVVRHVEPGGTPALAGVPSELFSMLGILRSQERDTLPGGALELRDHHGKALRILVEDGEVRVQWPHLHYDSPIAVEVERALRDVNAAVAKINGWVRFPGTKEAVEELQAMLDRFEGLYDEGKIRGEEKAGDVEVRFDDVNVGPRELLTELDRLAKGLKNVNAELHVESFVPEERTRAFRLTIENGEMSAVRPTLWK